MLKADIQEFLKTFWLCYQWMVALVLEFRFSLHANALRWHIGLAFRVLWNLWGITFFSLLVANTNHISIRCLVTWRLQVAMQHMTINFTNFYRAHRDCFPIQQYEPNKSLFHLHAFHGRKRRVFTKSKSPIETAVVKIGSSFLTALLSKVSQALP